MEADNTDKTGLDRRGLLGLGAMAAALAPLAAQAQTPAAPAVQTPLDTIPLWPGKAPGGEKVTAKQEVVLRSGPANPNDTAFTHITDPILMVRRPAKPNGAAIVMAPGGGYIRIAQSRLGGAFDKYYADQGVTVFILLYRLPGDGWAAAHDVALQDVQRAIRLIRSRAAEFQLDPARVGVIGLRSGTSTVSRSMSSGSASTTGPGRPEVATWKARPSSSGMRAASSICAAHLATLPNMRR